MKFTDSLAVLPNYYTIEIFFVNVVLLFDRSNFDQPIDFPLGAQTDKFKIFC